MSGSLFPVLVCIALFGLSAWFDAKYHRIPNILTLPVCVTGLIWHTAVHPGMAGVMFGLKGLAAGFGLLLLPYLMNRMGGGDVKLLAAAGACLGAGGVFTVFFFGSIAGGVMALGMLVKGMDINTLKGFFLYPRIVIQDLSKGLKKKMPYAVPLAAGFCVYLYTGPLV